MCKHQKKQQTGAESTASVLTGDRFGCKAAGDHACNPCASQTTCQEVTLCSKTRGIISVAALRNSKQGDRGIHQLA